MSKKLTIARAKELLTKFVDLKKEGQIDLNCCDSEDLYADVKEELNLSDKRDIRLNIDLTGVEIPNSVDENYSAEYTVTVKIGNKVISNDNISVEVDYVNDCDD